MRRASRAVSPDQHDRIEEAILEAESQTAAEIMPVIATASGRYDRAEDIIGLWTGLLLMCAVWCYWPNTDPDVATWGLPWAALKLPAMIIAVLAGFIVGAIVATRVAWLRRLFTPRAQMRDEVFAGARQAFFDGRVHHTTGGTGVLIYISLFERMAAIIVDDVLLKKLGKPVLDDMCNRLTDSLRNGEITDPLCTAIVDAGNRLAEIAPRADTDVNEFPNKLVIID